MAEQYINLSCDFYQNLKVKRLERRCGLAGVMSLLKLWTWAAKNRPDGVLSNVSIEDINEASEWSGDSQFFLNTLINLHFIEKDEERLCLHDWTKHQKHLLSRTDDNGKRILDVSCSEWKKLRKIVFIRDKYICQYCGAVNVPLECDHVFPFSRGGKSTLDNLVTACRHCNRTKSNKLLKRRVR